MKQPYGRVDQLEDRYLGMVEATSSNLVTSTTLIQFVVIVVDVTGFVFPSITDSIIQSNTQPRHVHHLIHFLLANGGINDVSLLFLCRSFL